jgi:hypothetical protein
MASRAAWLRRQVRKLRVWLGPAVSVAVAWVEHGLGETVAVAVLTAVVVIAGGILWRRVSVLMATGGGTQNCTKAYAVEDRLVNYMHIMAPLSPIVTANTPVDTNATFLAALSKLADQTTTNTLIVNGNGNLSSADAAAINGVIAAVNNLQTHLQGDKFEA